MGAQSRTEKGVPTGKTTPGSHLAHSLMSIFTSCQIAATVRQKPTKTQFRSSKQPSACVENKKFQRMIELCLDPKEAKPMGN